MIDRFNEKQQQYTDEEHKQCVGKYIETDFKELTHKTTQCYVELQKLIESTRNQRFQQEYSRNRKRYT